MDPIDTKSKPSSNWPKWRTTSSDGDDRDERRQCFKGIKVTWSVALPKKKMKIEELNKSQHFAKYVIIFDNMYM